MPTARPEKAEKQLGELVRVVSTPLVRECAAMFWMNEDETGANSERGRDGMSGGIP